MKKLITTFFLILASQAYASHPHDSICTVTVKTAAKENISFFLQLQSERQYVNGDPNKDVHDFTYQARICDDDNDASSCSTFETLAPTHKITEAFELVSMVKKKDVFFKGVLTNNLLKGNLTSKDYINGEVKVVTKPVSGIANCISQTWIKLEAEADSNIY